MPADPDPDPSQPTRLVDELCDAFDRGWRDGAPGRLEDLVRAAPAAVRADLLRELLAVEREYRAGSGRPVTAEEARARCGGLGPWADEVVDRAFAAGLARTEPHVPGPAGPPEVRPGTVLGGRYRVVRVLGRGGMGQVYLGWDGVLRRAVAVKVIRPRDPRLRDLTRHDARLREAFAAEAQIGAGLTHPAIATVHDFGDHDGEPVIVFEYLPGETLGGLIRRRGRVPPEEARLVVGPLAQALDFAHARGVVHRDLKPENVRADAQGHFKVLDLGLAREFRDRADWAFAGTPAYASPEQAAGLPCDGRADQYALALIAYELLTGRRPFGAADADELLRLHREVDPPPAGALAPDLPDSAGTALARALCKDPDRRFASCAEFAVALGCQLLAAPAERPEILRLAAVRGMRGEWSTPRLRLTPRGGDAHVVLTPDAVWAAHQEDLRGWPLRAVTAVGQSGSELQLDLLRDGRPVRQSFRFFSRAECGKWAGLIRGAMDRLPAAPAATDWPRAEPAVLLRRPPAIRYQALGPVEFEAPDPGRAEVGLRVRAALMGADAVADVQAERLPHLGRTVHRRSGLAIKAVDTAGRGELRTRWFAAEMARLCTWMLVMVGVSLVYFILTLLLLVGMVRLGMGARLGLGGTFADRLGSEVLSVALLHAWPLAVVTVARLTLWPQLLRPAAVAVFLLWSLGWALPFALGTAVGAGLAVEDLITIAPVLAPFLLVGGMLLLRLWQWAGPLLKVLMVGGFILFAPLVALLTLIVVFSFVFFPWRLARRAWLTSGAYHRLAPDAGVALSTARRLAARGTMVGSILLNPAVFMLAAYLYHDSETNSSHSVTAPEGPTRLAEHSFHRGVLLTNQRPQEAEDAFRRDLPLLQQLADANPGRPEYLHDLAATHQKLGALQLRRGEAAGAEKSLRAAVAQFDALEARHPGYRDHLFDLAVAQAGLWRTLP